MAASFYDDGKTGLYDGSISWPNDDVRLVLLASTYVFDASHVTREDIGESNIILDSDLLLNKIVEAGIAKAKNARTCAVTSGVMSHVAIYRVAEPYVSRETLIAYFDGLSIIPQGNNLEITWDDGKLFDMPLNDVDPGTLYAPSVKIVGRMTIKAAKETSLEDGVRGRICSRTGLWVPEHRIAYYRGRPYFDRVCPTGRGQEPPPVPGIPPEDLNG